MAATGTAMTIEACTHGTLKRVPSLRRPKAFYPKALALMNSGFRFAVPGRQGG